LRDHFGAGNGLGNGAFVASVLSKILRGSERVNVGFFRPGDVLNTLDSAVLKARGQGLYVLNLGEFEQLVKLRRIASLETSLPASIACTDSVLLMDDEQIRRTQTSRIAPADIRRLRAAYLLNEYNLSVIPKQQHETQILNHFPYKENSSLLDYENYLSHFFGANFGQFFSEITFSIPIKYLQSHSYISACSGHGKSELVKQLVYRVMRSGKGAIVLDPHGKLANEIAHWREFVDDPERLIYFNPYAFGNDFSCVPIINPLASLRHSKDVDGTVEGIIAGITAVVGSDNEFSNLMQTVLNPCLYTLALHGKEVTLYDLIDFLGNGERADYWRAQAIGTLENDAMLGTIRDFDNSDYKKTKSAIIHRIRYLLGSNALNSCLIGSSTIDIEKAMNQGKIIVFNLKTGAKTSSAFGRFIISSLVTIATQRSDVDKEKRPVFLFLDEADRFMTESIELIYKESRKDGLYITLVQQIAGYRLSADTMGAITGNSGLRFAGNTAASKACAKTMSEMTDTKIEDIKNLSPLNFWMKYSTEASKKFRLGNDLLGHTNSMSDKEWSDVLDVQRRLYYDDKSSRVVKVDKLGGDENQSEKQDLYSDY
jgi:hypothetical protein